MSIRIVTDSTCDLPESVVAEYGITVIPAYINVGDQSYLDGVELSREEFYRRLPDWESLPTDEIIGLVAVDHLRAAAGREYRGHAGQADHP